MKISIYKNAPLPLALLLTVLLMSACTMNPQKMTKVEYPAEMLELLSGQALIGHEIKEDELPNINLFAITPEMATFAEQAVANKVDLFDKVKALHMALLKPLAQGGKEITYSAFTTENPITTFNDRKANCLSFTLLYVALARHLGIDAHVNEVVVPPKWDMRKSGQLYYMQHVNVKISLRNYTNTHHSGSFSLIPDQAIIDLTMSQYRPTYPQKTISDELAAAKFYSNRGMEFSAEGKYREAFLYLRKALQINNQQSYIWNNFGSLFRRNELFQATEIIYLYGLKLNPDDLTIMNNLSGIYQKTGDTAQATIFYNLAKQYRQANPYYQYILAHSAFDSGDFPKALTYVKRAIDREKTEPRFYQLIARIYEQLGDPKQVEMMTKKYKSLSAAVH
jgi:tetratricopeptide (TPR) repeat protein